MSTNVLMETVDKKAAMNGKGKKYMHNGAWSFISLDKKSTACYGERYERTPFKCELPNPGDQVVIYERQTHERMADIYKEYFSRRNLADNSKPVIWTVAGFSRGNDRVNAMKSNNHVFLKRICRSGAEVIQSFPTAQIVVGVIKCVKATDVIL